MIVRLNSRGANRDREIDSCRSGGSRPNVSTRVSPPSAADPDFSEVAFLDCRFVGASLTGGALSAVLLRDCLAQLAKLSHLGRPHALLERCDLSGALLMESELCDVRFADCDLTGLELFNVDLTGSDLRDNELGGLKGVGCLRGATIDPLQLLTLGPALAAHVGLVVEEGGGSPEDHPRP